MPEWQNFDIKNESEKYDFFDKKIDKTQLQKDKSDTGPLEEEKLTKEQIARVRKQRKKQFS